MLGLLLLTNLQTYERPSKRTDVQMMILSHQGKAKLCPVSSGEKKNQCQCLRVRL